MSTVSLKPEPVDLNIKVVLIGEPTIYSLLDAYNPEFISLFKVRPDFETDMKRSRESQELYATLIARLAKGKELVPCTARQWPVSSKRPPAGVTRKGSTRPTRSTAGWMPPGRPSP